MLDVVLTLVFMMVFIAFAIWPAIKIVELVGGRVALQPKMQNTLTLVFTLVIAFSAALFMKLA